MIKGHMNGLKSGGEDLIVQTRKLARTFGKVTAVSNINLEIKKGELFGLVGPDGAGKTTVMRMLAGILPPTSGDAHVFGISVCENPEAIKEHIAYMPQRFGLYSDLTVLENLVFYADIFQVPGKERPRQINKLLGFSRLTPFKERPAGALSGGMKQKLGLACALIHSPDLLLLDEPTNGVDPVSRRDFWKILYDLLKEGLTVLVTTAYLDEAERMNRVALIHQGAIVEMGHPQDLKSRIQGIMMELITPDGEKAKKILEDSSAKDVNIFGESLHLRLSDEKAVTHVGDLLKKAEIKVESFRQIEPSMEDAFLSLIPK